MTTPETLHQPVVFHQQELPVTGQNMQHSLTGMNHCALPVANNDPRLQNKSAIWKFGIAEILIGGLSVLLTVISLSIFEEVRRCCYRGVLIYSSPGIWGGILVIVTGILAMRIKANHSRAMYIANMVIAIIAACATFSATFISGYVTVTLVFGSIISMFINGIITLLLIASWVIVVIHAAFCRRGVSFKNNSRLMQLVTYIPTQSNVMYPPQPSYDQGPNGQVMLAYVHQIPAQGYTHSGSPVQVVNRPQEVMHHPPPPQMMQPQSYNNSNANTDHREGKSSDVPKS